MKASEPKDFLQIKDAYTLYGSGKKRRYGLLFSVNGGAFAKLSKHSVTTSSTFPPYQVGASWASFGADFIAGDVITSPEDVSISEILTPISVSQ